MGKATSLGVLKLYIYGRAGVGRQVPGDGDESLSQDNGPQLLGASKCLFPQTLSFASFGLFQPRNQPSCSILMSNRSVPREAVRDKWSGLEATGIAECAFCPRKLSKVTRSLSAHHI